MRISDWSSDVCSSDLVEVSLDPTPDTWGEPLPRPVALNAGTPPSVLKEAVVLPFNDVAASEALLSRALPDLAGVLIDPLPSRMGLVAATDRKSTRLNSSH